MSRGLVAHWLHACLYYNGLLLPACCCLPACPSTCLPSAQYNVYYCLPSCIPSCFALLPSLRPLCLLPPLSACPQSRQPASKD